MCWLLFSLIIFFTYFYNAIQFDPTRQAEMLQRQGGFIPGVRPGGQTASFLGKILNRITLPGSVFLAVIAVLPAFGRVAVEYSDQLFGSLHSYCGGRCPGDDEADRKPTHHAQLRRLSHLMMGGRDR